MDWLSVAKVVVPIVVSVFAGSKVVAKKVSQGKRLSFLASAAGVVYYRVEWEKTQPSVSGWESKGNGDLMKPENARMRAQMLIGELCFVSGQKAPDLKETQYLDKLFINLSKASKYLAVRG